MPHLHPDAMDIAMLPLGIVGAFMAGVLLAGIKRALHIP